MEEGDSLVGSILGIFRVAGVLKRPLWYISICRYLLLIFSLGCISYSQVMGD
jgi:hypothetical protein